MALAACSKQPDPNDRPPPADVAANFNRPLDARGGDPQWSLKIRGRQLTLSRADQPDVSVTAPGATIQAHSASWTGSLADGQSLTVNVYDSACIDAQSGMSYPFTAEIELPDTTPLDGCGGPPAGAKVAARSAPSGPVKR
ncbi:MAG TPA: hypothetical protein VFE18_17165 [Phenylobacterium sp.]|uniref:hypothetical protein n=1 Tax=Phenylobacterium sp. TaxID=1871053 RepID=UPI002D61E56F|nr:hypothetical protein [Phenylobacterium sp.]HZZ69905.1 hypothetical protein [Phenylobacterium sp.]